MIIYDLKIILVLFSSSNSDLMKIFLLFNLVVLFKIIYNEYLIERKLDWIEKKMVGNKRIYYQFMFIINISKFIIKLITTTKLI